MKPGVEVKTSRSATAVPLIIAVAIVAITFVPYLFGIMAKPPDGVFTGFTYNVDDAFVYASWIKQISDGSFLIQNQFTSAPQQAFQFNLFFIVLGLISRITHLSPAAVLHLSRALLGVIFLMLIWKYSHQFLKDPLERMLIVPIIGLSSGLGWTLTGIGGHKGPVDMWQPEAITFLSIYLNPLFLIGMILMVAAFHYLYKMKETGSWRDAIYAGLMLLLLGNIHTYDVLTVGVVWAAYIVVKAVKDRKIPWKPVYMSLVTAIIAMPSVGYQFYLYMAEDVFKMRVESAAPSPAFWAYLMGYGLVIMLAIAGGWMALKEKRGALLLVVWSVAGFALPYLPFAQQRKLIMGLHIPLAILATIAIAAIVRKAGNKAVYVAAALIIATLVPSNIYFLKRDISHIEGISAPDGRPFYISNEQMDIMRWFRDNTDTNDVVLAFPSIALYTPAISGNRVYYGHWSETPDYKGKFNEWIAFMDANTPDEWRKDFLKRAGVKYIVYFTDPKGLTINISETRSISVFDLRESNYAIPVFKSGETAVYEVEL